MGNQTILRLPTNLALSSRQYNQLVEILGDFQEEYYSPIPDLKQSYERRMDTLHHAFLFIIESIPPRVEVATLEKYLAWCQRFCRLPDQASVNEYQSILTQYTGLLVNALVDYYDFPKQSKGVVNQEASSQKNQSYSDFSEATEILNKAEQYLLMKQGRKNLATLIPLAVNKNVEWVLLRDTQLPPYTNETLDDLKRINRLNPRNLFSTPLWFRELYPELQTYLHSVHMDIPQLITNLDQFLIFWIDIKSRKGNQLELDLKSLSEGKDVDWSKDLIDNQKKLIQIFSESFLTVTEVDSLLESLIIQLCGLNQQLATRALNPNTFERTLDTLRSLPYWFLVLTDYEQYFLKSVLNSRRNQEELVTFLPSRLRRLPMVANFCEHQVYLLSKEGSIIKKFDPRLRSSHLASRDVASLPKPISSLHTTRNLEQILSFTQDKPVLVQTLISPIPLLNKLTPDYTLEQQLKKSVKSIQDTHKHPIFLINHPLNLARIVYFTAASEPICNELLHQGNQALLDEKNFLDQILTKNNAENDSRLDESKSLRYHSDEQATRAKDLANLLNEYHDVLNSPVGSATVLDHHGRELFLSSLEHLIIVHLQGKSYGSCVSGKDRKQIEILHTDAMLLYRERYGRWPSFKDENYDRSRFVNLVAVLYTTRHIHEHAGQNAPGSDGIKTPANYWPRDIAEAILKKVGADDDSLIIDDRLATNNEVRRIGKIMLHVKPRFATCLNAANQLSQDSIKKVIDTLSILSEEHSFWGRQTWLFGAPTGINRIRKLLQTPLKHEAANLESQFLYKLAEIYFELTQRPKDSSWRNFNTQMVYSAILKLYSSKNPESEVNDVLNTLKGTIKTAFQHNVRDQSRLSP